MHDESVHLQVERVEATLYKPVAALCCHTCVNESVHNHEKNRYPDAALRYDISSSCLGLWLWLSDDSDWNSEHNHANVVLELKSFIKHDVEDKCSEEGRNREHAWDDCQIYFSHVNVHKHQVKSDHRRMNK